jgi:signal transduction histidine kinase
VPSGERRSLPESAVKRRLVAVIAAAIALPALLLAYGSLTAVRADRFVLRKLREERLAGAAREAIARIEEETRERARAALAELDPEVVAERVAELPRAPLAAAPKLGAIEAFVELARERAPLAREAIVVDGAGRLLLPRRLGAGGPPARPRPLPLAWTESGPEGDPGGDLRGALETLEARKAAERRLAEGRALEIDGRDARGAAAVYREVAASAPDPELAARARLDLARCEARLGSADLALSDLEVLARVDPDLKTEEGLSIAATARLRSGEVRIAAGRAAEGAGRLLDLIEDVLEDRLALGADEVRFFLERARAALDAPELAASRPPAFVERLARLDRLARRRDEQRAYAEELESHILPDLMAAVRATPPSGAVSHLATIGGTPRLFAFRVVEEGPERVVVAIEVALSRVVEDVATPWLAHLAAERGAALELVDRRGAVLAAAGTPASGGRQGAATGELEDLLPFWRVRALPSARDDDARLERFRLLLQVGLVVASLLALGLGAAWAFRAVGRSMELARMKSEFVSNVSHELRTPLTSIRMFAEMLRSGRARTPEKRDEYLDTITRESERLQKLIDDILDFARHEAGRHRYRFETGDIGEAAEEALAAVGAQLIEAGFKIDLDVRRPLPPARLDRKALQGALENLLTNARKYAGERREVALRVRTEAGGPGGGRPGIAVEVADRGVGIAEDELGRVFDKFFRGEEALALGVPGSGLGLALVKRIVEDHGGTIVCRSKKGEGTTFAIWLPAAG